MGHAPREQTEKLKEKLLEIRVKNNLSQNGIIKQLGLQDKLIREDISKFERGIREPSLPTLLKYAQFANIYVDVLINDELNLPEHIPASEKSEGIPAIR
jgi:transcriptional regulator with XRE-family HTH domain